MSGQSTGPSWWMAVSIPINLYLSTSRRVIATQLGMGTLGHQLDPALVVTIISFVARGVFLIIVDGMI